MSRKRAPNLKFPFAVHSSKYMPNTPTCQCHGTSNARGTGMSNNQDDVIAICSQLERTEIVPKSGKNESKNSKILFRKVVM